MRTLSPAALPPPFHSPARPLFPRPCPFFPSVPPLPTRLPASTRFLPPSRDSSLLPCCSLAARHSCDRGNNRREVSARDSASSLSSSLFLSLSLPCIFRPPTAAIIQGTQILAEDHWSDIGRDVSFEIVAKRKILPLCFC